jgi:dTDP-4-dehydrorhamnose reductase
MSIELWGGLECTVNRVADEFFDQVKRSGHHERPSDLELFAELGLSSLRYPILWERTAPDGYPNWRWADERLNRLRELGLNPIVGLLHHGSGPRHTSLIDSEFPEKFSTYARMVAERYPWVRDYTPVNEPLTTARFSGLYGHWYPHGRDEQTFARALLNECRGTVLAMREIRKANPNARLIQTEDIARVFSTPKLAHQADFENERRWLSYDLLCGRLTPGHRMWSHLIWAGIPERELHWFKENSCCPDIVGINHYVTSDRYLDENICLYPPHTHGTNGREHYADVEAVRVDLGEELGLEARIAEIWQRYGLPIAVTEAHLGCTEDEQVRWLWEVWNGAQSRRARGVDLRAITFWSLLGAYDWHCLLTREEGRYEPGAYDLGGSRPRATAVAEFIRGLRRGQQARDPVLSGAGWWRRPERIHYRPAPGSQPSMQIPGR